MRGSALTWQGNVLFSSGNVLPRQGNVLFSSGNELPRQGSVLFSSGNELPGQGSVLFPSGNELPRQGSVSLPSGNELPGQGSVSLRLAERGGVVGYPLLTVYIPFLCSLCPSQVASPRKSMESTESEDAQTLCGYHRSED